MASLTLRPRFRVRVDLDPDQVMQRFEERIDEGDLPCRLDVYEHQVEFSVLDSDHHFWSPFLNLLVESEDGETRLHGKYGPNVNVWSMFLAAYAALTLAGLAGLIIGASQYQIGQQPTGLIITGVCAGLAVVVYAVGRLGRSLAHPQMVVFHNFVERLFADRLIEMHDEEEDTKKP